MREVYRSVDRRRALEALEFYGEEVKDEVGVVPLYYALERVDGGWRVVGYTLREVMELGER